MTAYRVGAEPSANLARDAPGGIACASAHRTGVLRLAMQLIQQWVLAWRPSNQTAELLTAAYHAAGLRGHRVGDEHVRLNVSVGLQRSPPSCRGRMSAWYGQMR